MYDKHPRAIITDQDSAMKKAIGKWHIMIKARERAYNHLSRFCNKHYA
jgi:hypothetical protein